MQTIQKNILLLKEAILQCEKKYSRSPGSVSLLAVTKGQSINSILQAVDSGATFIWRKLPSRGITQNCGFNKRKFRMAFYRTDTK